MLVTNQPRIRDAWMPCGRRENRQDYYVVRDVVADYSDYWGVKVDPDGKVRHRYAEEERQMFVEDTRYIADWLNEMSLTSVLDFGAGLGWLLDQIEAKYKAAVEIAPQAIEHLDAKGIVVWSRLEQIPPNSFDAVVCHHVFEHLKDPLDSINHVRRIMRSGGYLVMGTPDFGSPCAKRFGDNYRMLHDKTHCSLFTLESMTRFLRDHAFEILDVTFPFPERYATAENFMRWNDTSTVSPPWPGNWITFFCRRGSR